jgi:hypothetical protein
LAGGSRNYIKEPMPPRGPERTTRLAEFTWTMLGQPLLLFEDKFPTIYNIRPSAFIRVQTAVSNALSYAEKIGFLSEPG